MWEFWNKNFICFSVLHDMGKIIQRIIGLVIFISIVFLLKNVYSTDIVNHPFLTDLSSHVKDQFHESYPETVCEFPSAMSLKCYDDAQIFQVHSVSKTGRISTAAFQELGPNVNGFVLEATVIEEKNYQGAADYPQTFQRPYWETYGNIYPIQNEGFYVHVSFSYGKKFNRELLGNLIQYLEEAIGFSDLLTDPIKQNN